MASGNVRDMMLQTSNTLQAQMDALEGGPGSQVRQRSRSPRGQRPVGAADDGSWNAGVGAWPGTAGGMGQQQQTPSLPCMPCMAQMGMQPNMMQQQMAMMMQPNMMQQMMQQQQFMMMQMMMSSGAMGMMGNSGAMSAPQASREEPEETQRRMGQQVMANTMAALRRTETQADADEGDEGAEEVAPGPSANVNHPNYRPPDMQIVPGLTDTRFEGVLKMWSDGKGYGFIECDEIRSKYPDGDVFLHHNQRRHFERGDKISFNVFLNFKGRPQATELRRRSSGQP